MKHLIAAALLGAACLVPMALAAEPVSGPNMTERAPPAALQAERPLASPMNQSEIPDARSFASEREVGEARRFYRAQCVRFESPGFCECVTAGIAQALAPADVRVAARTSRERLTAMGDTAPAGRSDMSQSADQMSRIEQTEGFYADACAANRAS